MKIIKQTKKRTCKSIEVFKQQKANCIWIVGRSEVGKTSLTKDLFPETEMMDIQFSGQFINCDNFK